MEVEVEVKVEDCCSRGSVKRSVIVRGEYEQVSDCAAVIITKALGVEHYHLYRMHTNRV